MEELIGKKLGQYLIEAKIGRGGMAVVYKAYQTSLDRYVAVKVLPPSFADKDPGFVKRFEREARAIARLDHPNILPVYDFGVDGDYSYIVMRYVAGSQTLVEYMRERSLSYEQAIDLISQIARALTYAHQQGVIHRDVKPSNVLMDNNWVLLSDFGLAKVSEATSQLTGSGVGMGTPAYMSPEQGKGEAIDHRTDIYAMGVILYQMLTGTIPHHADTPWAILLKRTNEPPSPPREINPAISPSIEQVMLRSLATNPKDRYASAVDFAQALQRAADDESYREPPVELIDESTMISIRSRKRVVDVWRNPGWVIVAVIALAGLVIFFGIMIGGDIFSSTTPPVASLPSATSVAANIAVSTGTPVTTSTPTPTQTPPSPIDSPTPQPTPTPIPPTLTYTPTNTPIPPTLTPTHTPRPTATTPTSTPIPSMATPIPTISTSPPPTRSSTPTPDLPDGTFTLLSPINLEKPSFGPTEFEWKWIGPVPPELGFEISVWREGEAQAGAHDAILDNKKGKIQAMGNNQYQLNIDITQAYGVQGRSGEYLWTVALVQISPTYAYLGQQAEPARLRLEIPGYCGGGGGGSGDGGGSVGSSSGGGGVGID